MTRGETGRRRFLGTVAAGLSGGAGCLDRGVSGSGTSPTPSGRPDESETEPERPDADVTVRDVTVRPEVVALKTPDSIGPYGGRGDQFLLARVAAAGEDPPMRDEFAFEVDGETFAPTTTVDGIRIRQLRVEGGRADPYESGAGWLVFQCPKPVDANGAALTWPGGEHVLAEGVTAGLGREPASFEVTAFDVPESVETGETVPIGLTVANVSDSDGTFVAGLNRAGGGVAHSPETALAVDVPAGESATWEYRYPDGDYLSFVLHWRGGRLIHEVAVETE